MKVTISRSQWEGMGKKAGWIKKASNWAEVQDHNDNINIQRRKIKSISGYLNNVMSIQEAGNTGDVLSEAKSIAQNAISRLAQVDKVIAAGYMDSGYAYDDKDPRNQMIDRDDESKWGSFGGDLEQRVKEETERATRKRIGEEELNNVINSLRFFDDQDNIKAIGLEETLSSYLQEINIQEQDYAQERMYDPQD